MDSEKRLQFERLAPMIGHTPLLAIDFTYRGEKRRIFAKAEWYNPTGSIKDRVAFYLLQKAYERDQIRPDEDVYKIQASGL